MPPSKEYGGSSEIRPHLWQGGTPLEEMIYISNEFASPIELHGFTAVVTLDASSSPAGWSVSELRYRFDDGHVNRVDLPRILEVADWAYEK